MDVHFCCILRTLAQSGPSPRNFSRTRACLHNPFCVSLRRRPASHACDISDLVSWWCDILDPVSAHITEPSFINTGKHSLRHAAPVSAPYRSRALAQAPRVIHPVQQGPLCITLARADTFSFPCNTPLCSLCLSPFRNSFGITVYHEDTEL